MKKVILACILFVSFHPLFAQSQERRAEMADSLQNILDTQTLSGIRKIELYRQLANLYDNYDFDKSIASLKKGLELSEKENKQEVPHFARCLGVLYGVKELHDTAQIYLERSVAASVELKDKKEEILSYRCVAHHYYRQNKYAHTMDYCMKVLQMSEATNDTLSMATALNNIGSLYRELGNLDRALYYIQKHISLVEKSGWMPEQALYELGLIYMEKGELDKALDCELKAIERFHNRYQTFEIYSMQAVAKIYTLKENWDKASEYARESIRMAREYGDHRLEACGLQILSGIYYGQKDYEACETTATSAWTMDSTALDTRYELAYNIAFSNLQLGNKEKASFYFKKFKEIARQSNEKDLHKTMMGMEMEYETEKKEMRIATLEKNRKLYAGLGVAVVVALLSVTGVLFYRHRLSSQKRKIVEQQIKQLEQEKELVAARSALDAEKAEREIIARDLHDGVGAMLSVVKNNMTIMKSYSVIENKEAEYFNKALDGLDKSIVELRRVAHHIMPAVLVEKGLFAALDDFCRSVPEAEFHYSETAERRFDPEKELVIYRCAYELVSNALKHSGASRIEVHLNTDEETVYLSVVDDGCGFDQQTAPQGMGIKNLNTRLSTFGGHIEIYSEAGKGTEANVEIEI